MIINAVVLRILILLIHCIAIFSRIFKTHLLNYSVSHSLISWDSAWTCLIQSSTWRISATVPKLSLLMSWVECKYKRLKINIIRASCEIVINQAGKKQSHLCGMLKDVCPVSHITRLCFITHTNCLSRQKKYFANVYVTFHCLASVLLGWWWL